MKKIIFFLSVLIVSCNPNKMLTNALTKVGILDEQATVKKINNSQKEIYFIEMKHLAKQEFYDNVLFKVDSFKKEGFFVLAESVTLKSGNALNTLNNQDSIIILKARKLIGYLPTAYSKNDLLVDIVKDYKLVDQPLIIPKTETKNSKIADAFFDDLMSKFEKERGVITLSECDYKTPFQSKYECKSVSNSDSKYYTNEIVSNYRDTIISNLVLKQPQQKLLLVYGKAHYEPIKNIIENIK